VVGALRSETVSARLSEWTESPDWAANPSAQAAQRLWTGIERRRHLHYRVLQGCRTCVQLVAGLSIIPLLLQLMSQLMTVYTSQLVYHQVDPPPHRTQVGPGGWELTVVLAAWVGWAAIAAASALAQRRHGAIGIEPPGLICIKKRGDERPGLECVRSARRSALVARAAIESIDSASRDLFVTPAFEALDRSVWDMARAATQSSDPEVLADLRAGAAEAEAVARDSEALRRQLLEELPAYRSAAEETLATPVVRMVVGNARADIETAGEAVRAMRSGLEEAREATGL
jgi:hypothetical protein